MHAIEDGNSKQLCLREHVPALPPDEHMPFFPCLLQYLFISYVSKKLQLCKFGKVQGKKSCYMMKNFLIKTAPWGDWRGGENITKNRRKFLKKKNAISGH